VTLAFSDAPPSDVVARADVWVLSAAIEPPSGVSIGLATAHEYVLVQLTDSSGVTGWGETYLLPGVERVIEALARLLVGRPAASVSNHRLALAATRSSGYAVSALMIALDDLRARQLGVSINRMYGGPTRTDVRAYAASQGYVHGVELERTWVTEAEKFLDDGYTAMKLRTGRFSVDREARALHDVREMIGPEVALMVDGNGGYTAGQAVRMGSVLEEVGVRWFEEPLPQDGYRGYPQLRGKLTVPLAGGEILETPDAAQVILTAGAVDILQPDVVICGGIGAVIEIARLARIHGVSVIPHTSGGAIGIAATLQLLAVLDDPNRSPGTEDLVLEFGQGLNPWRTGVFEEPLEVVGGRISIPCGPGLGLDIDTEFIEKRAAMHLTVSG